jgi:medium-chain acyl-[acyl-carrier-protein] hydrolase
VSEGRRGAQLRLLCFPYAGGSAAAYRGWADRLPPGVDLRPVELPGHGARISEPRFTRLEPLAEALHESLRADLEAPFACFGHSLGALVAYELARTLQRAGRPGPVRLYVSGHRAPHLRQRREPIHALPDADLVREIVELDPASEEAMRHEELRELALPILRDDFTIAETYRHARGEPLETPIVAFGGASDPIVDEQDVRAWAGHTSGPFTCHIVAGGHLFLETSRDDVLELLARDLRGCMRSS